MSFVFCFFLQILDRIVKSVDTTVKHYFSEYVLISGKLYVVIQFLTASFSVEGGRRAHDRMVVGFTTTLPPLKL